MSIIVLVMYDARTKLADQVVQEVRAHFGDKVSRTVVPRTVRLSEAPSFGQPIIAFDPSSRGAIAYRELAKEVSGGAPQRARSRVWGRSSRRRWRPARPAPCGSPRSRSAASCPTRTSLARALRRGSAGRAHRLGPRARRPAAGPRPTARATIATSSSPASAGGGRPSGPGSPSVPAIVRDVDDTTSLEQALVENLHRQDLNPLEEAAAYQQLIEDFGLTHDQVATRVGKSRAAVTNTLRLFQLPPAIQQLVADGAAHRRPRPGAARHPGPGLPGAARPPSGRPRTVGARGRGGGAASGPSWRAKRRRRSGGHGPLTDSADRPQAASARPARARGAVLAVPRHPGQRDDGSEAR